MPNLTSRRAFVWGVAVMTTVSACAQTSAPSNKKVSKKSAKRDDVREIDLALWAGVSGAIVGTSIDVRSGSRRIRGPIEWHDPIGNREIPVYERINQEKKGEKRQLFSVSADGSALSRVYDHRPGAADRYFTGDAFFPLGRWSPGERRSYRLRQYQNGVAQDLVATIRIRRLDYKYKDIKGSLKYDWILTDESGNVIFNERYIYSPGKGFVKFKNLLA